MLKSCPKRLVEEMPKSGRFMAIYLDVDQEIETVGEDWRGLGVKPHEAEDLVWVDGDLFYYNGWKWEQTTPEKRVEYWKEEAEALMFVNIPAQAVVLEPIKTAGELEAEAEAKRDAFALMYGGRQMGKTMFPAAAVMGHAKPFYSPEVWKAIERTGH